MATQLDNDPLLSQDDGYFQYSLPNYYRSVLKKFRKISRSFIHFNLLFSAIFLVEITSFFLFLPFLNHTIMFALALTLLFVTGFSYCILLLYFQTRKPEQILVLKDEFLDSCRRIISVPQGMAQHHLSIAEALSRLSQYLHDFEWGIYKAPQIFPFSATFISRFSAFCFWEDVFTLKQLLLTAAIEEHFKQIRVTPTDLEVHASLAGTYVAIAKVFREPIQTATHPRSSRFRKIQESCEEKATFYSRLAMEEFKILSHYAANDPWVHEQMALGYKDLGIPEEEIKEVELLLKLRPQDKEILYRLGSLYFSQGLNAKGLQIYEELKRTNYKKAEDLISSYGSFIVV